MNKQVIIDYLISFTRVYLALVFILSGLDKVNDLDAFAQSIENYKIFPISLVNVLAITIPWIELVVGGLLLIGLFIRENSFIISSLLIIFTLAVLSAILRDLDIECGCRGTFKDQKVSFLKIIENISLLIVAFLNYRFPKQVLTFINKN